MRGQGPADPTLWTQLVRVYECEQPSIERFARRRVGQPCAEDITSQVFEAAAAALAAGRCDQVTPRWLMGIAKHKVADHWRRSDLHDRRRPLLVAERARRARAGTAEDTVVARHLVGGALACLPARQRDALTLRYVHGHPVAEVAMQLEISVAAAESLLARARNGFRRWMDPVAA